MHAFSVTETLMFRKAHAFDNVSDRCTVRPIPDMQSDTRSCCNNSTLLDVTVPRFYVFKRTFLWPSSTRCPTSTSGGIRHIVFRRSSAVIAMQRSSRETHITFELEFDVKPCPSKSQTKPLGSKAAQVHEAHRRRERFVADVRRRSLKSDRASAGVHTEASVVFSSKALAEPIHALRERGFEKAS